MIETAIHKIRWHFFSIFDLLLLGPLHNKNLHGPIVQKFSVQAYRRSCQKYL